MCDQHCAVSPVGPGASGSDAEAARPEPQRTKCDCERQLFDCEQRVRRFLGADQDAAPMDLRARDELMEKTRPLIERIVSSKLQGRSRQDREDAVQEIFLKLCDPAKLRTWVNSEKRTWFCHWAVVVAIHCVIDGIRRSARSRGEELEEPERRNDPPTQSGLAEEAKKLRDAITTALSEFELDWQLVFCMKYSYVQPCISEIGRTAKISDEAVFFRLRKIKERIVRRFGEVPSPDLAKIALVGTRHPLGDVERMEPAVRDQMNQSVTRVLAVRPVKEQYAFYMRYSPLAVDADFLAAQVGESRETVCCWLEQIEKEIRRCCLPDLA